MISRAVWISPRAAMGGSGKGAVVEILTLFSSDILVAIFTLREEFKDRGASASCEWTRSDQPRQGSGLISPRFVHPRHRSNGSSRIKVSPPPCSRLGSREFCSSDRFTGSGLSRSSRPSRSSDTSPPRLYGQSRAGSPVTPPQRLLRSSVWLRLSPDSAIDTALETPGEERIVL